MKTLDQYIAEQNDAIDWDEIYKNQKKYIPINTIVPERSSFIVGDGTWVTPKKPHLDELDGDE